MPRKAISEVSGSEEIRSRFAVSTEGLVPKSSTCLTQPGKLACAPYKPVKLANSGIREKESLAHWLPDDELIVLDSEDENCTEVDFEGAAPFSPHSIGNGTLQPDDCYVVLDSEDEDCVDVKTGKSKRLRMLSSAKALIGSEKTEPSIAASKVIQRVRLSGEGSKNVLPFSVSGSRLSSSKSSITCNRKGYDLANSGQHDKEPSSKRLHLPDVTQFVCVSASPQDSAAPIAPYSTGNAKALHKPPPLMQAKVLVGHDRNKATACTSHSSSRNRLPGDETKNPLPVSLNGAEPPVAESTTPVAAHRERHYLASLEQRDLTVKDLPYKIFPDLTVKKGGLFPGEDKADNHVPRVEDHWGLSRATIESPRLDHVGEKARPHARMRETTLPVSSCGAGSSISKSRPVEHVERFHSDTGTTDSAHGGSLQLANLLPVSSHGVRLSVANAMSVEHGASFHSAASRGQILHEEHQSIVSVTDRGAFQPSSSTGGNGNMASSGSKGSSVSRVEKGKRATWSKRRKGDRVSCAGSTKRPLPLSTIVGVALTPSGPARQGEDSDPVRLNAEDFNPNSGPISISGESKLGVHVHSVASLCEAAVRGKISHSIHSTSKSSTSVVPHSVSLSTSCVVQSSSFSTGIAKLRSGADYLRGFSTCDFTPARRADQFPSFPSGNLRPTGGAVQLPNFSNDDGNLISNTVPLSCFSTGNEKVVSISSSAMKRARSLILDEKENQVGFPGCQNFLIPKTFHVNECERNGEDVIRSVGSGSIKLSSFPTVCGKQASVSSLAMHRPRLLIQDEKVNQVGFPGFKNLTIRETSDVTECERNGEDLNRPAERDSVKVSSFSTGNGRPVSVSSLAIKRARLMLQNDKENQVGFPRGRDSKIPGRCDLTESDRNEKDLVQAVESDVAKFSSFSTGNGKPTSSLVTMRASSLLQNEKDNQVDLPEDRNSRISEGCDVTTFLRNREDLNRAAESGTVKLSNFSTGNGKPVSVSCLALKWARSLLQNEKESQDGVPEYKTCDVTEYNRAGEDFDAAKIGGKSLPVENPHTASVSPSVSVRVTRVSPGNGSRVFLSALAVEGPTSVGLEKEDEVGRFGERNSDDVASLGSDHLVERKVEIVNGEDEFPGCRGLVLPPISGSGPRLIESHSGAPYASHMFHVTGSVLEERICRSSVSSGGASMEAPFSSFLTGSGKSVSISKSAIDRAKILLEERVDGSSFHSAPTTDNPSRSFSFLTGSGVTISISDGAIAEARVLLGDVELRSTLDVGFVKKAREGFADDAGVVLEPSFPGTPRSPGRKFTVSNLGQGTGLVSNLGACKPGAVSAPVGSRLGSSRAFKPPRCIGNARTSKVGPSSELAPAAANSLGNREPPLDVPQPGLLLPSSLKVLQDGCTSGLSGLAKLKECFSRPPNGVSQVLPLSSEVMLMTPDVADNYRFLYLTEDGVQRSVGSSEARNFLLGCGADPRYVTNKWVSNHYRWVVWKLARYERSYPRQAAGKILLLDTVLFELRRRYDAEYGGRRSAIRRITERDSSASQPMVLCVSAIRIEGGNSSMTEHAGDARINQETSHASGRSGQKDQQKCSAHAKIEVTDGWYRLNTFLDSPLTKLLQDGKLKVGSKLLVCGATFSHRSDGSPPLESFPDASLTIHMNGTYRARENQRLGFCQKPVIPLAFDYIKPDGGLVPHTYVGVTRIYPPLFREKTSERTSVLRSARAEEMFSNLFERRRDSAVEAAVLKYRASVNSKCSSNGNDEGVKLFEALENASQPEILMADMAPAQLKALAAYQARKDASRQVAVGDAIQEALEEAKLNPRNVQRLLKVRVVGLKYKGRKDEVDPDSVKEGIITIWDPTDEQTILEGSVYRVAGLTPMVWRSSRNDDKIQLQSFKSTRWCPVPRAVYDKCFLFPYKHRVATTLSDMNEKFLNREFDVAAIVLQVGEPLPNGLRTSQWVFMTDGSTAKNCVSDSWDETQLLAVRINVFSETFLPFDKSIVGTVIGYSNLLQKPKDHSNHLWVAEASELSVYSSNFTSAAKHLKSAAHEVSEWARTTSWMVDQLREFVETIVL